MVSSWNADMATTVAARERPADGAPMLVLHGVRREALPGVGHFLNLEAPDLVTGLLLDWVSEHP